MIKQNHDDCDFRISLDRSEFMADKGFQYHIHQGLFEVLYCLEGDVECKIAGIVYPFPPHTLLIVKPEIPHATYVHSNQPYVRYVMHFSDQLLSPDLRYLLCFSGGYMLFDCSKKEAANAILPLLDLLNTHKDELNKTVTFRTLFLETILAICHLGMPEHGEKYKYVPEFVEATYISKEIQDLIDYIDLHFSEPLTLTMLSNSFNMSKNQLNRLFREKTGTTIINYVISKRISHAHYLQEKGIPCTEAAQQAGFNDYSSFYRSYVRRFGVPPSNRKNVR